MAAVILRLIVLVGVAGIVCRSEGAFRIRPNYLGSTLSETNLLAPRSYCGFQHVDDSARDNDNLSLDEYPWIALLLDGTTKDLKCAGTLINYRYVMTVAHCVIGPWSENLVARLGEFNVMTGVDCLNHTSLGEECSDPVKEYSAENVIVHPKYNHNTSHNDIALVRLSRNVEYSEYIRPICLPSSKELDLNEGVQLAVSGWGKGFKEIPPVVRKRIFAAWLLPICECMKMKMFKNSLKRPTNDHLCAYEVRESTECKGEGGSPLMLSVKNQWEQVGIVAFGATSCGLLFPTVYVKITSYLDWIKFNVKP